MCNTRQACDNNAEGHAACSAHPGSALINNFGGRGGCQLEGRKIISLGAAT